LQHVVNDDGIILIAMQIELYDASTLDKLDWPDTEDGQYAKRYLTPFVNHGIKAHISNIDAESYVLKVGDIVVPVVMTNGKQGNSWVCSSHTHYIAYGQEYTSLISNPVLNKMVNFALKSLGKCTDWCKLDRIVYVNNWLFAVDLFPQGFSKEHVKAIRDFLKKRFPEHAIAMRSLYPLLNKPLMGSFKKAGFKIMASRYVHVTDMRDEALFKTRILKSDLKLMREAPYQMVDIESIPKEDYPKLLALYHSLYITQHSPRNPYVTQEYMRHIIEQRLLGFKIVKQGEVYKGIAGYVVRDGIFLCPFFGYEKNDPDHNVVYRLLSTALALEAKERGLIFNQSAGATFYKTIRRAKGCFEYNAIYTKHLPFKQRAGWATLKTFINTIAPPFMKKY